MQLTPREFDKLLVHMLADVALKRRAKGLKLNYPEAVAVISATALDGARAGTGYRRHGANGRELTQALKGLCEALTCLVSWALHRHLAPYP